MGITRNSAKCLNCGDHIESTHRHDFQVCECWTTSDKWFDNWCQTHPEATEREKQIWCDNNLLGISVDGGKHYIKRGFRGGAGIEETSEFSDE